MISYSLCPFFTCLDFLRTFASSPSFPSIATSQQRTPIYSVNVLSYLFPCLATSNWLLSIPSKWHPTISISCRTYPVQKFLLSWQCHCPETRPIYSSFSAPFMEQPWWRPGPPLNGPQGLLQNYSMCLRDDV
jgi:hypothetical protein